MTVFGKLSPLSMLFNYGSQSNNPILKLGRLIIIFNDRKVPEAEVNLGVMNGS